VSDERACRHGDVWAGGWQCGGGLASRPRSSASPGRN
jgi:hypothetical protein